MANTGQAAGQGAGGKRGCWRRGSWSAGAARHSSPILQDPTSHCLHPSWDVSSADDTTVL